MKKAFLPIILLLVFSFDIQEKGLSTDDRKMATAYLEDTRDHMQNVLKGLSKTQLNFQPYEESWTIAQCVEHLAIAENTFGEMMKGTLAAGPNETMRDSLAMADEQLYMMISSREKKVKTPEPFEPSGKFGNHEETLTAFLNKRNAHISYTQNTTDDLRNHFNSNLPFGTIDGVQLLLFMAGHTERHVMQMEEIKTHKLFPKK
ncbi:DinB family protein [uncultured Croceitalea sp.]|uniref:DinB family protein n=1 Tax=uncultured Croceitalea sp. TaxID=1798908 RepID=UPI003305971A